MAGIGGVGETLLEAIDSLQQIRADRRTARTALTQAVERIDEVRDGSSILAPTLQRLHAALDASASVEALLSAAVESLTRYLESIGVTPIHNPVALAVKPTTVEVGDATGQNLPQPDDSAGTSRDKLTAAVDVAVDVCQQGWQATVADQAAKLLTDAVLRAIEEGDPPENWECRTLAAFADEVLATKAYVHSKLGSIAAFVVETAVGRMTDARGIPEVAAAVTGRVVESLPLPVDTSFEAVARVARIAGVAVCAPDGLQDCRCLADLALSLFPGQLRKVLEHGFDLDEPDLEGAQLLSDRLSDRERDCGL